MGFGSPEYIHTFVEAKKVVYEDRAKYYADPDFYDAPVEGLISKDYAAERRRLIDPDTAAKDYAPGNPRLEQGDTIYLAVADKDGNMVSLIQSNYRGMGSGVVPVELGFSLHNRGALFSLDPGHPNVIAPGKRPAHTIMPGFVTAADEPWLAFGVMGASMQPQGQVQVLLNLLEFGMGLQAAGDAPRVRHEGSADVTGAAAEPGGGTVHLEPGFGDATVAALAERGHRVRIAETTFGGYQAVARDARACVWRGASEYRKDGQAAGY